MYASFLALALIYAGNNNLEQGETNKQLTHHTTITTLSQQHIIGVVFVYVCVQAGKYRL